MSKENQKIITVSFVIAGFLAGLVVDILFETAAASFGVVAKFRSQDLVQHGLPVAVGLITFGVLQFNKNILTWADEVLVEVRKVVWPSKKDTVAMTTVCCVMLIMSGVVLGVFDFVSGQVIKLMMN